MISPALVTRTSSLPNNASSSSRPRDELLEDHVIVELEGGEHRITQRSGAGHLGHADGRSEIGGLDEDRKAQRVDRLFHDLGRPRGAGHQAPRRHGKSMVVEDGLGDALVHADGRREDAGTDVGHVERFEMALDHAVLTERPVQRREHHHIVRQFLVELPEPDSLVVVEQVVGRGEGVDLVEVGQDPGGVDPALVVGEPDRRDREPRFECRGDDAACRDARDLVLGRRAAVDDRQRSRIWHRPRLYNRPRG